MKLRDTSLLFFAVILAGLGPCAMTWAQTAQHSESPRVLLSDTFASKQPAWMAFGSSGEVRLTPEAAHAKTGKPALAFNYKIAPNQLVAAVLPVEYGSLAKMTRLKFWLKTDSSTGIAILLSEKKPEGGNYGAVIWSPKDTWQQIELTPGDFAVSEGPTDPKDPDNKLDLDEIEGIGVIDLGQMFVNFAGKPDLPLVVDVSPGAHTFCLDELQALAESPAASPAKADTVITIDDFHRPQLGWITLGGAELSRSASDNPLGAPALEARYEQIEGKFVVFAHPLAQVNLRGSDRIAFDISSNKDLQMVVSLETRKPGSSEGPRYNTAIQVPGNGKPVHESLAFTQFNLDENSPSDPDGKLIPEQIKTVSLIDITGAFTHERQKNTFWVSNLRTEGVATAKPQSNEGPGPGN